MSTSTTMTTSVAARVVIAGLIPALALAEEGNDSASSEMRARLTTMKERSPNISVTIFPGLVNQIEKQDLVPGVAEAMALLFERAGVKKVDVSEDFFRPSAPDDVWKIAREFGRFVQDKPVEADYAVFAELIGTPQTGLDKVFTVAVDKAGDPVWVDTQARADPLVKSIKQHTPFTARLAPGSRSSATSFPGSRVMSMEALWRRSSTTGTQASTSPVNMTSSILQGACRIPNSWAAPRREPDRFPV